MEWLEKYRGASQAEIITQSWRRAAGRIVPTVCTRARGLAALAAILAAATMVCEAPDRFSLNPADKSPVEITWEAPLDQPQLLEAITLQLDSTPYREDIPLDRELQAVLWEVCEAHGVPLPLALGLIEEESHFQPATISSKGAYGLCQLNPKYFPDDLDPAGNIAAGIAWLGELLEQHGDTAAALRAYNLGHDDGDRVFANAVLAAAEKWEEG